MKKILSTGLAMCLMATAFACDICGCSVSNYNPFLFPQLSKGYVGVSYINRTYKTHPGAVGSSTQHYNAVLLTAQYSLTKKLQVVTMVPYSYNIINSNNTKRDLKGLGDISVLLNYKVWEKLTKAARQTVTAGAGIKAATGNYTKAKTDAIDEQNFQLGTGSTDYILNGSYLLSYRKLMLNAAASYKYNTQNKAGYRFGDVFTTTATAVYRKDVNTNFSVAPYVQVTNEAELQDASNRVLIAASGGNVFYSGGGVDVNTRKIAMGINYQTPVAQNLAGGVIQVKSRVSAHLSFTL